MKDDFYYLMSMVKYQIEYYRLYINRYNKIEKIVNLILGVVSTGSLAALFIRPQDQFRYAVILALAQIASAAKPYLWFESRASELEKILLHLELLFVEMEAEYGLMEEKKPKEAEIVKLIAKHKKEIVKLQHECMPKDVLTYNKKYAKIADDRANDYFTVNYVGADDEPEK